jgi:Phage major capsid protein E
MPTYTYPDDYELRAIESSKVETLEADDPFRPFVPTTTSEDYDIRWTVEGYQGGLQQLRGLNGDPTYVKRQGLSDYIAKPGVYGDFMTVDEEEMTRRSQRYFPGLPGARVDLTDLVMRLQDQLLDRRVRLVQYIRATLLMTGTFAIADKKGTGGYRHTDSFSLQTYDASTWATVATATPIADFRAVKLLGRGLNADFSGGATAIMNNTTFNNLIGNTNAADLGGQKTATLSPLVSAAEFNRVMLQADLPQIVPWDGGYYAEGGSTFNLFVPNGKVAVISRPMPQGPVGEYRMTWQAITRAPGPYAFVKDSSLTDEKQVPPTIEVHDGHNGGPVVFRPWQVVIMDVS